MPFTENQPQDEESGQQSGRVVVLCSDLFFGTQIAGVVRDAGFDPVPEMSLARALGHIGDSQLVGLIVDLELSGLDLATILQSLPEEARPRVIAFGPHVHEQRLNAARVAGCDSVLTRGQITSSPAVLRKAIEGKPVS